MSSKIVALFTLNASRFPNASSTVIRLDGGDAAEEDAIFNECLPLLGGLGLRVGAGAGVGVLLAFAR